MMDPRRHLAALGDFAQAVGETLCALADSLLHRQCVTRELHEDVRVERDAVTIACQFLLKTVDEQHAALAEKDVEIAALQALAGAPLDAKEGE